MDTKQFLRSILDSLQQIDYVKPEDVPNIDLYMDQVTTFMDSQLAASKRHDDDKILTKTMINNYGFYYMKYLCYSIRTSNERKGKYNHEYI